MFWFWGGLTLAAARMHGSADAFAEAMHRGRRGLPPLLRPRLALSLVLLAGLLAAGGIGYAIRAELMSSKSVRELVLDGTMLVVPAHRGRFRALGAADVRRWAAQHCSAGCRLTRRNLGDSDLWVARVHSRSGTTCYLFDAGAFRPSPSGYMGYDGLSRIACN